jgi:hypothetical protein
MDFIRVGPELLDYGNKIDDLAERIRKRIPESPKGSPLTTIDFFLRFFLLRNIKAARSIVLLTENNLYQDVLIIGRSLLEGRYYLHGFLKGDSLADKWTSFYLFEKYKEECQFNGKAADKILNQFAPELVRKAMNEFDFTNITKRQEWYKFSRLYDFVEDLDKIHKSDEDWHKTFYSVYSRAIHWTPLGIIEAENYAGAVLMTAFLSLYEISMFANDEFGLGFG